MTTATRRLALFGLLVALLGVAIAAYLFSGDGRAKESRKGSAGQAGAVRAVLISTVAGQTQSLEIYEEVVGSL